LIHLQKAAMKSALAGRKHEAVGSRMHFDLQGLCGRAPLMVGDAIPGQCG
jgi:hypothetical protein